MNRGLAVFIDIVLRLDNLSIERPTGAWETSDTEPLDSRPMSNFVIGEHYTDISHEAHQPFFGFGYDM